MCTILINAGQLVEDIMQLREIYMSFIGLLIFTA